jgi:molybdopterin molybdotransferase
MKQSVQVAEAQEIVLDCVTPLGVETVPLLSALHRVIAEDVTAPRHIPLHDNSAMDGYAVRHNDVEGASAERPVVLDVVEILPAGKAAQRQVAPGKAIKIMTGAPMPAGADTVVRVEYTEPSDTTVRIMKSESGQGANIRPKGEDVIEGDCIIAKGTQLRSGEIGMLAILAKSFVLVYQRPRVAILSTGDELADLDESFDEHKIVNSNSYGIAAAVQESGGIPVLLGIAKDDPDSLKNKIRQGLTCDILVLSGGVSMGDYDFTKPVFAELGADMNFWKLAIRPGQPVAFGKIQGKLAFGLPGNPVSSMVTFDQLVRPAMLKMAGHKKWERPVVKAIFQEKFSKHADRRHFLRGILHEENGFLTVRTTGGQGSGILTSMVKANGFIDVPEEVETLNPGDLVDVQLLSRNF